MLRLRNPHSILAAIACRPHDVPSVWLPAAPRGTWAEVSSAAERAGIPRYQAVSRREAGPQPDRRGSAGEALVRPKPLLSLEAFVQHSCQHLQPGACWLALEELQDPHNIGAILRSAAFFQVRGVLLTRERTAPLSETVYDVASGGMEWLPICQVVNLASSVRVLKAHGLWVVGMAEQGPRPLTTLPVDRPWLVIIGNEEHGLRRLTRDLCDELCHLPAAGPLRSLNASVAAGVTLALLQQRHPGNQPSHP
ncbi:MAG: 23S rRNA (guanosine-2'-O-)-methyltransferase RlmB [Planctomycetaceae bacterium]|nr:MAG: 23S rRNA (guanosine-2'-O-)-methyltransferase RlmB [Planctomycetaceae bacterium]